MTAVLVSITTIRQQNSVEDVDAERLQMCLDLAEGIVLNHCKHDLADSPHWDDASVPANVKQAIIIVTKRLFDDEPWMTESLYDAVRSLLYGYRDPTLA